MGCLVCCLARGVDYKLDSLVCVCVLDLLSRPVVAWTASCPSNCPVALNVHCTNQFWVRLL